MQNIYICFTQWGECSSKRTIFKNLLSFRGQHERLKRRKSYFFNEILNQTFKRKTLIIPRKRKLIIYKLCDIVVFVVQDGRRSNMSDTDTEPEKPWHPQECKKQLTHSQQIFNIRKNMRSSWYRAKKFLISTDIWEVVDT